MQKLPTFKHELLLWNKNKLVIGVDEVGRGALCGPITVGAVCLKPCLEEHDLTFWLSQKIDDSKRLTPKDRERLSSFIKNNCLAYAVVSTGVSFINKYGIVPATRRSVRKAVDLVSRQIRAEAHCLLDAFYIPRLKGFPKSSQTAIIKGDRLSVSIAAASIIAKVERDHYMTILASKYPAYKWDENKGYGTKIHRESIRFYGSTKHHRSLFIHNII